MRPAWAHTYGCKPRRKLITTSEVKAEATAISTTSVGLRQPFDAEPLPVMATPVIYGVLLTMRARKKRVGEDTDVWRSRLMLTQGRLEALWLPDGSGPGAVGHLWC